MPNQQINELIGPLLRDVSRSFYLTLRVLPAAIRPQISQAYLLARATDTIADTEAVPRAKRVLLLQQLQNLARVPDLGVIATHQTTDGERRLLERLDDCVTALEEFEELDCRRIQELLRTIVAGQIFDLQRYPEGQLTGLSDDNELDQYTYMVAGCVGEFWTKMCCAHLPALRDWNEPEMSELGVRFGKGLQLVNILRDIPRDLRLGRCYLPVTEPARLLVPANFLAIKTAYNAWLDRAVEHLDAGWKYTTAIPRGETRLRLACIWPIWIGLGTIALLRDANPLDSEQRVKVSRAEVYRLMTQGILRVRAGRALSPPYSSLLRCLSPRGSRGWQGRVVY